MWGEYCCKTEWEDTVNSSIIACDGSKISVNSICCEDNQYQKCPKKEGCQNNRGMQSSHN